MEQSLNQAGDEAFNDFSRGVNDAGGYLRKNRININRVNLPKFYNSFIKQYLAAGMADRSLWIKARNDMREALNPKYASHGQIILQPSQAPDLAEVLDLRDFYDYQQGRYSTTAFTDNTFNPHAKNLQQSLNKLGLTDKFSNQLKEDGILGPKTQWAMDTSSLFDDVGKSFSLNSGLIAFDSVSGSNGYRNFWGTR